MEEEYQKALELIFAYGYGCCVFKHNICGDHLDVPNGMLNSVYRQPPKFFTNSGCPSVQGVVEATVTEVPPNETTKEPMEVVAIEDQSRL